MDYELQDVGSIYKMGHVNFPENNNEKDYNDREDENKEGDVQDSRTQETDHTWWYNP